MDATRMNDILDTVLRTLYDNMDKDGLSLDEELLGANKIQLTASESERVWEVLRATGLVESIIGFGKEGRLELTPAGIQMMTRFGSYKNFLATQATGATPQVTISVQDPGVKQDAKETAAPAQPESPQKAASGNKGQR